MPFLGPESAALLACPGAVLFGFSAAAMWQFARRPDVVHVVAATNKRTRKGLIAHRGELPPEDVRVRQGLSLTSPYRTILDLRGQMRAKAHNHAVWEASYRRLITDDQPPRCSAPAPGRQTTRPSASSSSSPRAPASRVR